MNILLLPAIATIFFIFFCLDEKERYRIAYIIIFFFMMLGLSYIGHAEELTFSESDQVKLFNKSEISHFQQFLCFPDQPLSEDTKEMIWRTREISWERFLCNMQELQHTEARFSSSYTCKDAVHDAIAAVVAATQAKNITSAGIIALSCFLENILEKFYDEWVKFRYKCRLAQHYLEIYEFCDYILLVNAQKFNEDKYNGPYK